MALADIAICFRLNDNPNLKPNSSINGPKKTTENNDLSINSTINSFTFLLIRVKHPL